MESHTPHSAVEDRVYIAQNMNKLDLVNDIRCFRPKLALEYHAGCDDFGPLNMSSIVYFITSLDKELESFPDKTIALCVEKGKRQLTNAVFLLGSYMIIREEMTANAVAASFDRLDATLLESNRDAKYDESNFDLCLFECWCGLEKGKLQGWIKYSKSPSIWGKININHYRLCDDADNGNMQHLIPSKIVGFQGPVHVDSERGFSDTKMGERQFSPSFYTDYFHEMGVSTIISLDDPLYDAQDFTREGFEHYSLDFGGSQIPPGHVVAAFLSVVQAAAGAVAVHCSDGLGKTGTLVALYLMKSCGFTALEAIAWLRVMRPGSVIGDQQHYLCLVQEMLRSQAAGTAKPRSPPQGTATRPATRPPPRPGPLAR